MNILSTYSGFVVVCHQISSDSFKDVELPGQRGHGLMAFEASWTWAALLPLAKSDPHARAAYPPALDPGAFLALAYGIPNGCENTSCAANLGFTGFRQ